MDIEKKDDKSGSTVKEQLAGLQSLHRLRELLDMHFAHPQQVKCPETDLPGSTITASMSTGKSSEEQQSVSQGLFQGRPLEANTQPLIDAFCSMAREFANAGSLPEGSPA